jgi:hypothetical protein
VCRWSSLSARDLLVAENDIDGFIALDVEMMRCDSFGGAFVLVKNQCRGLLNLCISDSAKPMLLHNPSFIPHLLDGLLLDAEHPRKDSDEQIKSAVQRDFAECIQQIVLFGPGCVALSDSADVVGALDTLVDKAWSEEAKICARGALKQLCPGSPCPVEIDPDALHVMYVCNGHLCSIYRSRLIVHCSAKLAVVIAGFHVHAVLLHSPTCRAS